MMEGVLIYMVAGLISGNSSGGKLSWLYESELAEPDPFLRTSGDNATATAHSYYSKI